MSLMAAASVTMAHLTWLVVKLVLLPASKRKKPWAILTHCYGHALNLAVGDCVKKSTICRDALDVALEIAKLVRFSQKRNAAVDRIRVENVMDEDAHAPAMVCELFVLRV